jgi:peptidoglycan/LPS O-acetylase OafA/YrhL
MTDTATLGALAQGRDNNLNLMRMVAASLVLMSHSYVLSSGATASEPWNATLGMSPGSLAVDIFFVISGFLVTASLLKSRSVWLFTVARAMRIYPGLWIALLVSTLVVCVGFTSLSVQEFIRHPQTWRYLARNAVMITGGEAFLPGTFTNNPFAEAVNGSLWTLRYELRMYALLAVIWVIAGKLSAKEQQPRWFSISVLVLTGALMLGSVGLRIAGLSSDFVALGAMFFAGASAYVLRGHIPLRGRWVVASGLLMAAGACWSQAVFGVIYGLLVPYVIFYLAFVPRGLLRRYNRVGDYSYGIYIYAFPVQQMLVALRPDTSVWALTAAAGGITLVLAALSWHSVERPAMHRKDAVLELLVRRRRWSALSAR